MRSCLVCLCTVIVCLYATAHWYGLAHEVAGSAAVSADEQTLWTPRRNMWMSETRRKF